VNTSAKSLSCDVNCFSGQTETVLMIVILEEVTYDTVTLKTDWHYKHDVRLTIFFCFDDHAEFD